MIDTATNTVVATITTPVGSLQGVAINPAGTRAYYTDTNNASLYVVDTATNTVIATVAVGSSPEGVDVTPNGAFVYVANSGSASVSVISTATNTVVATIPTGVGSAPFAIGKFITTPPSAPPPPPPPPPTNIPTVSEWILLLMAAMLAGLGLRAVRRRDNRG